VVVADSVDEWLALARQHEAAARHLLDGPDASRATVPFHVGTSVECALKAVIMQREGLNRWPDRNTDYWTHDLNKLRAKLRLVMDRADAVAPLWQVVITWNRGADYVYAPKPMPLKVAKSYIEAAYGPNGVMEWVLSKLG
jgi:hypothetical protein